VAFASKKEAKVPFRTSSSLLYLFHLFCIDFTVRSRLPSSFFSLHCETFFVAISSFLFCNCLLTIVVTSVSVASFHERSIAQFVSLQAIPRLSVIPSSASRVHSTDIIIDFCQALRDQQQSLGLSFLSFSHFSFSTLSLLALFFLLIGFSCKLCRTASSELSQKGHILTHSINWIDRPSNINLAKLYQRKTALRQYLSRRTT
jgi:hypothetical protein